MISMIGCLFRCLIGHWHLRRRVRIRFLWWTTELRLILPLSITTSKFPEATMQVKPENRVSRIIVSVYCESIQGLRYFP